MNEEVGTDVILHSFNRIPCRWGLFEGRTMARHSYGMHTSEACRPLAESADNAAADVMGAIAVDPSGLASRISGAAD